MTEDAHHLAHFAKNGDEAAFRELVTRHFNMVYSASLRQLNGHTHLAEDVAQSVFADLARKAGLLPRGVVLTGWLYEAARRAAANAVRREQRRRQREKEAITMHEPVPEPSTDWEEIAPILDAAMGQLSAHDRNAVLLHYFERKGFRAIGAVFGISDDAAQKRVTRALGKLRSILMRRGVTVSAATLATMLTASTVQSAPAGLSISIGSASLACAAAAGSAGFGTLVVENLAAAKTQVLVGAMAILLLSGAGVAGLVYAAHPAPVPGQFVTVDLTGHYNGDLTTSWTPAYGNNHLQQLGQGRRVLKQVPFDIRGVVQLQGTLWKGRGYPLPESVVGIPAGGTCRRIHILHANSGFADPVRTMVANLVLHYTDGEEARLQIREGVHCLDWWAWSKGRSKVSDPDTLVAWTGWNPAAKHQGAKLRLFKTAYVNPQPDKEIKSIDYVSAMAASAPFMIAMTLEK
jgi:RNA polymerase sigma factor (sigma-70 family)